MKRILVLTLLVAGCGGDDGKTVVVIVQGTGGQGAGGEPAGTGGDEPDAGQSASGGSGTGGSHQCLAPGDSCGDTPTDCCVGTVCARDARAPANGTCAALCKTNAECQSGCCVPTGSGVSACAPSNYCGPPLTCQPAGSDCAYDVNSCCASALCIGDQATGTILCRHICTARDECVSGCCAPVGGSPYLVCSDPSHCP